MAKIGITGASGFIGSNLARRLVAEGHHVIALTRHAGSQAILDLSRNANFRFRVGDIRDLSTVLSTFDDVDVIYHIAGNGPTYRAHQSPSEDLAINAFGTTNILEVGRINPGVRIVTASSGAVYMSEDGADESQSEWPSSFYGTSKRVAERYASLFCKHYEVSCVMLRLARVFGPGMHHGIVLDAISAHLEKRPIRLYAHPDSDLDLIYVDDVVEAFVMASNTDWPKGPVNISTGSGTRIASIANYVNQHFGITLPIEILDSTKRRDILNNRKANSLGWYPFTSLESGLLTTIEWFKQQAGQDVLPKCLPTIDASNSKATRRTRI